MIQQAPKVANPLMQEARKQSLELKHPSADWLVIAHDDQGMLDQLASAFEGQTSIVVEVPQSQWDLGCDSVSELLGWAIRDLKVKGIVLVGHSRGGTPHDCVKVLGETALAQGQAVRLGGLSEQLERVNQLALRSQEHFVDQLEALVSLVLDNAQHNNCALRIDGLFYRSETETFCNFDANKGEFCPLAAPSRN